jgi:hypothetical protein
VRAWTVALSHPLTLSLDVPEAAPRDTDLSRYAVKLEEYAVIIRSKIISVMRRKLCRKGSGEFASGKLPDPVSHDPVSHAQTHKD